MTDDMQRMLDSTRFAVVGASRRPSKYGYIAYRHLKEAGKTVYAVNPTTDLVDGDPCYPSLSALPETPEVAVMIVPSASTEKAVDECAQLGIKQVWMQPGAESPLAVQKCREHGIAVVSGGPCIMVLLHVRKSK